jgi:uncharacterized protein YecE (DUF72 family)
MRRGRAFIGTSGWNYRHWRGSFYPPTVPPAAYLDFYARFLRSVEVNKAFYRLLSASEVRQWVKTVPPDFVFAVKGSRFITHMVKLKDPARALKRFFAPLSSLSGKMGPVLFQLPPHWRKNTDRLAAFLKVLPADVRTAWEFREPSWFSPDVYDVLKERGAAVCRYELAGYLSPDVDIAPFSYLRLHGPTARKYQGSYSREALRKWAAWVESERARGHDAYVYFDNDDAGFAVKNAILFQELVAAAATRAPRRAPARRKSIPA